MSYTILYAWIKDLEKMRAHVLDETLKQKATSEKSKSGKSEK